jgi:hypothetical protein
MEQTTTHHKYHMTPPIKLFSLAAIALVCVAASLARAAVITVVNPSFETTGANLYTDGYAGSWYNFGTSSGWVYSGSGDYGIYGVGTDSTKAQFTAVPNGTNTACITNVTPLSQVLDFTPVNLDNTVHVGDTITLSFYMGQSFLGAYPAGTFTANIYAGATNIGTQNFNASGLTLGTFSLQSLTVASSSAAGALKIEFVNGTNTNFIDEVSVTAAVPEPATWTLLAVSLTTVMVLRRRRSA